MFVFGKDHAGISERLYLGIHEAQTTENFTIVLAQIGRTHAYCARRARHFRHHAVHGDHAHFIVRIFGNDFTCKHVRVLHKLRDVVNGADRHFVFVEERHVFSLRHFDDEITDDGIQIAGVFHTLGVGFIAWVFE